MPAVGSLKVDLIGGRTDSAGTAQPDQDQEEARLDHSMLQRPGVWPYSLTDGTANPNAWRVRQGSGSNLFVTVGSGVTKADGAVVRGTVTGQGTYLFRLDSTGLSVAVPAADPTNPRKYGVYLWVDDANYSGTASRNYAGVSCIAGTPAGSPTVPGPLAVWSASLLIWSFQLAAAATAVTNAILDNANAADARTSSTVAGLDVIEFAVFS